ncbi:MAG: class I SAM-dependent methyltransferase [Deltaproteobacteria bacterium]|nr:class I SAM-dependent methyltransferase [Deltaproteobacteria bacterium]
MPPTIEASGPNAQQIEYWNQNGSRWVNLQDLIDPQIRPLGLQAMDAARITTGETILDVGCGCGDTSRELARRVGAGGKVTGVDISSVMLERARELTQRAGLANATFRNADAQTYRFEPAIADLIFSRFGVMFFAQPDQAFANLLTALRPGGRLAFVCWQQVSENAWMFVPMLAALQHIPPPPLAGPDAPGPFAFADPEKVRGILTRAGFGDVAFESLRQDLIVGGGNNLDVTVDFMLQMGPTAAAIREADLTLRETVRTAVRQALEPYATDQGVRMGSASWIVTAQRP